MPTAPRQFWIGVVSREHVRLGVKGGFIQLGHGKKAPLQRLRAGDALVMYSPRTAYPDGEPLQAFTAIGVVSTGEVYQVQMKKDFKPFRVDVKFIKAKEAPIKPLIEVAEAECRTPVCLTLDERQGVKIPAEDFKLIAKAMGVESVFQANAL